jgi:hypothetical protein
VEGETIVHTFDVVGGEATVRLEEPQTDGEGCLHAGHVSVHTEHGAGVDGSLHGDG